MFNPSSPLAKSLLFHLAVFVILLLSGLEIFSRTQQKEAFVPISVEILNIAEQNNIPQAQQPANKPKPKTPPKPKPPKPKPPKPKEEPKPAPKPEPKPAEKPKEKPVEKPKEEPKPERNDQDEFYESLMKDLQVEEDDSESLAQTQETYDANKPLAVTEKNRILGMITKQIQNCWIVTVGARGAEDLVVEVDVDISRDGRLKFIGFAPGKYYDDAFSRAAAESARRAILDPRCNPLREIPPMDKYDFWKELTIGFDPKQQIY